MRRLRNLRLRRFLTQQALADKAGVALYTLQRWEAGASFPRPAQLGRLCEALDVEIDDLIEADEWPQQRPAKIAVAA